MTAATPVRLALLGAALAALAACGQPAPIAERELERAIAGAVAVTAERGPSAELRVSALTGAVELLARPDPAPLHGAGVVLDDGYVLTSAHLVDGAARVLVRLPRADSPPRPAEVAGVSVCDDLALLRLDGEAPRPAPLGAAADLRLGAPVYALGFAPAGAVAAPTLSEGIVTWVGPGGAGGAALLTTSAALAPGGSGGPLLTADGAVVGVATAGRFAAPAQGADYVIGIDYGREVAAQLRESGSALSLGLELAEVAENDALHVPHFGPQALAGGLFVRGVAPGAAAAGLQPGDLIVGAAGAPARSMAELCGALRAYAGRGPAPLEALRRSGDAVEQVRATLGGEGQAGGARPAPAAPAQPTPIPLSPTAAPAAPAAPAPAPVAAPASAVELGPAELQAARDALAAERAQHRELFFETFDSASTKLRWRPADEPAGARQLVYSYYQLTLRQPGAVVGDVWPERPLGPSHIVELEVALPASGGAAVGVAYDQQADGSGLSYFVVGADGSWQAASFQGGALVPGRYLRGASPAFVAGGGSNFLRVVRLPEGTQLWLNDTLVARVAPGPFAGGHAGVIAVAGPEPLPQPVSVIADNFRLLERP